MHIRGRVNAIWGICGVFAVILAGITQISAAEAKPIRLLALGTSLTQGYNLPPGTDYCALLQARLRAKNIDVVVINAGVSGDTSAGGLARLEWSLQEPVDGAIVELGANDALRGLDVAGTRGNIDAILDALVKRKIPVLLAGMKSPRNLGLEYSSAFDALYPELASKHKVLLYPFFLDGVVLDRKLNQADGIHPNEKGSLVIVGRILPYVEKLVGQVISRRAAAPQH